LALVIVAVAAIAIGLALLADDSDDDAVGTVVSTTIEARSSEVAASPTAPASTRDGSPTTDRTAPTPTAPSTTIEPARCSGTAAAPDDPEPIGRTFIDAWLAGDRACASRIASSQAVDAMFAEDPPATDPTFGGCTEEELPDPHLDCAFTLDGDSLHLWMNYGAIDGWRVASVLV
jgi:hypothetical protein